MNIKEAQKKVEIRTRTLSEQQHTCGCLYMLNLHYVYLYILAAYLSTI